jgi:transcriptional regulator GlxA family with amidase domain
MSPKNRRVVLWSGLGVIVLAAAAGGAWILSLPAPVVGEAPPVANDEAAAILEHLKPPKRARPVVAIVGINDATEVTDYAVPYGILRRSGIVDVMTLATGPGPVKLYPAMSVEPHATLAEFDQRYPDGADYVIVPAMSRDDDPAVLQWLQDQSKSGALVVGVCAGAKIVGEAGLLDGKRATTHWYYVDELLEKDPSIQYVPDRRMVIDRGVATTTGITASIPMVLTLIEAIAGREKAEAVAREVGLTQWDAEHDSEEFQFTRPFALTAIGNAAAFWNREELGIELTPGVDEVSLSLVADAWSRTYRSRALTFSQSAGPLESKNGLRIIPDRVVSSWPASERLPAVTGQPPGEALDAVLRAIGARYGDRTAYFVAMQLEYPRRAAAGPRIAGSLR